MAVLIKGITMPEKCEDCPIEVYIPKTTESYCAITGRGVAWCRKISRPATCPLIYDEPIIVNDRKDI